MNFKKSILTKFALLTFSFLIISCSSDDNIVEESRENTLINNTLFSKVLTNDDVTNFNSNVNHNLCFK